MIKQDAPELMTESIRCWCGEVQIIRTWANPRIIHGETRSFYSGYCYACGRYLRGYFTLGEFPPSLYGLQILVILWDIITFQNFERRKRSHAK